MAENQAPVETATAEEEPIAKRANDLYEAQRWDETRDLLMQLPHRDTRDPDVLWQLIRIHYRIGKHSTPDKAEQQRLAQTAEMFLLRAMEEGVGTEDFQCQKWAAIALGWISELKGQKERIIQSFAVRKHIEKAMELNPKNASIHHLMGRWCFSVASVSWSLRTAASVFLATPPTSTYEEALAAFLKAEENEPGFYVMNWVFVGKSYLQLKKKAEAREWLTKAAEQTRTMPDDIDAQTEARALLGKL